MAQVAVPRIWNVPPRNSGFTGREELLERVRDRLLSADRSAVQVLRGMGGVGKTQLATEFAYRWQARYGIAWWISAEQPGLIAGQVAALAPVLGCVSGDAPVSIAAKAAVNELRTRSRWLLVFDNAESAEHVLPRLPGGTDGHVIITARAGAWHEISLTALEVPQFSRTESVRMLRERLLHLNETEADLLAGNLAIYHLPSPKPPASWLNRECQPLITWRCCEPCAGEILQQRQVLSYPDCLAHYSARHRTPFRP